MAQAELPDISAHPLNVMDTDAIETAAATIEALGVAVGDNGSQAATAWAPISEAYKGPGDADLLAVMTPVATMSASVKERTASVAASLRAFKETADIIKADMATLKSDLITHTSNVENYEPPAPAPATTTGPYGTTTSGGNYNGSWNAYGAAQPEKDWRSDGDLTAENERIIKALNDAVERMHEAERVCMTEIRALNGLTALTAGDGDYASSEYGVDSIPHDAKTPWAEASATPDDESCGEASWNWVVNTGKDAVGLIGMRWDDDGNFSWTPENFADTWSGMAALITYNKETGQWFDWGLAGETWVGAGKDFLAWDRWAENPQGAFADVLLNVGTSFIGGAGVISKIVKVGGRGGRGGRADADGDIDYDGGDYVTPEFDSSIDIDMPDLDIDLDLPGDRPDAGDGPDTPADVPDTDVDQPSTSTDRGNTPTNPPDGDGSPDATQNAPEGTDAPESTPDSPDSDTDTPQGDTDTPDNDTDTPDNDTGTPDNDTDSTPDDADAPEAYDPDAPVADTVPSSQGPDYDRADVDQALNDAPRDAEGRPVDHRDGRPLNTEPRSDGSRGWEMRWDPEAKQWVAQNFGRATDPNVHTWVPDAHPFIPEGRPDGASATPTNPTGRTFDDAVQANPALTKGEFGENQSSAFLESQGYTRIDAPKDANAPGIDMVFQHPDGHFVIVEAKYNTASLDTLVDGTPQMSEGWLTDPTFRSNAGDTRIQAAVGHDRGMFDDLMDAYQAREVTTMVAHVAPDGTVTPRLVDSNGRILDGPVLL